MGNVTLIAAHKQDECRQDCVQRNAYSRNDIKPKFYALSTLLALGFFGLSYKGVCYIYYEPRKRGLPFALACLAAGWVCGFVAIAVLIG